MSGAANAADDNDNENVDDINDSDFGDDYGDDDDDDILGVKIVSQLGQ